MTCGAYYLQERGIGNKWAYFLGTTYLGTTVLHSEEVFCISMQNIFFDAEYSILIHLVWEPVHMYHAPPTTDPCCLPAVRPPHAANNTLPLRTLATSGLTLFSGEVPHICRKHGQSPHVERVKRGRGPAAPLIANTICNGCQST